MDNLLNESQVLTSFISEVLLSAYQGIRDKVKGEVKERDFFDAAAKKYGQKITNRYNYIRVFGMSGPVPLRNIYVRANILKKVSYYKKASLEELEKAFDQDKRRFGVGKETHSGIEVLNKLQRYIVLGKPGAGKTTYLKYLALRSIDKDADIKERRIPIFIVLKELSDKRASLLEYITEQFDISGVSEAEPFFEQLLKTGKCLLLLDGLDEVDEERRGLIIQEIIDWSEKYDGNQFIVSCRVAAYNHWFQRFHDVEMADFNEEQIKQFVNNWFAAKGEPEIGKECFGKIKRNGPLLEMGSTPLLLTLLCIAYDENYDFLVNRAELYQEAIQALLKKWDATRRIKRKEIYRNLTPSHKEQLFSIIAMATFSRGQYFFSEVEIVGFIKEFLSFIPEFSWESVEEDAIEVLEEMIAQHGIIAPRAKQVYSFAHLTFQEYFTAKFIVENRDTGALKNLVTEHFGDDKWREVFLLTTSMLPNANDFFLLMQGDINRTIKGDSKLMDILSVIEKTVARKSSFPISLRRAYGLFIVLVPSRVRALNLAIDIDIALAFAHNLVHELVHDSAMDLARALELARDTDGVLARAMDKPDFIIDILHGHTFNHDRNIEINIDTSFDRDIDIDIEITHSLLGKYLQLFACLTIENYASRELKEKLMNSILALPED